MNPNKPSPPPSPWGRAPPRLLWGQGLQDQRTWMPLLLENPTSLHASGPAPPAQPPTLGSTLCGARPEHPRVGAFSRMLTRGCESPRFQTGRLEGVALGWRKAAPLLRGSASRQIQPPPFWGTNPVSPFLSGPSLLPLPPTGLPL